MVLGLPLELLTTGRERAQPRVRLEPAHDGATVVSVEPDVGCFDRPLPARGRGVDSGVVLPQGRPQRVARQLHPSRATEEVVPDLDPLLLVVVEEVGTAIGDLVLTLQQVALEIPLLRVPAVYRPACHNWC